MIDFICGIEAIALAFLVIVTFNFIEKERINGVDDFVAVMAFGGEMSSLLVVFIFLNALYLKKLVSFISVLFGE